MLAVKGVYENGVVRPLERIPGRRKREVIITFVDKQPSDIFETQLELYVAAALEKATYEKLSDGSYSGTIPGCLGVITFADTLTNCQRELESVLRDWVLVKRKRGAPIPVLAGVDLNRFAK